MPSARSRCCGRALCLPRFSLTYRREGGDKPSPFPLVFAFTLSAAAFHALDHLHHVAVAVPLDVFEVVRAYTPK